MTDFNQFDQQGAVPQRQTGSIIAHSVDIYKGIFFYGLAAMAAYFLISWALQMVLGINTASIAQLQDASGNISTTQIENIPNLGLYGLLSGIFGLLTAPLYAGLIYIANKFNTGHGISMADLFIGYRQNLLNILIYCLLTSLIIGFASALCVFPAFFVMPLFMLGYPFLLFENASAVEAMKKSFDIAKENYGTFLGATALGILISISGVLLCFVGVILTAPFIVVVMYSLYCAYVGRPRPILS